MRRIRQSRSAQRLAGKRIEMTAVRDGCFLITGANGFAGRILTGQRRKTSLREVVPLGHGHGSDKVLDVCDAGAVDRCIKTYQPSFGLHLAAMAMPGKAQSDPNRAWMTNLDGTRFLAEAVMRHVPDARFVYTGSSESYGASFDAATGPISEDAPLRPITTYGATKAAADVLIGRMAHTGLQAIRFRPFNHTSPGQSAGYVVPAFARQIAEIMTEKRSPVMYVGNLAAERDFVDAGDVVRAYAQACTADCVPGPESDYNIASGEAWRIGDLLQEMIALSGKDVKVQIDPSRICSRDLAVQGGSPDRIRSALGWTPEIPLKQTLSDILSYWHQQFRQRIHSVDPSTGPVSA